MFKLSMQIANLNLLSFSGKKVRKGRGGGLKVSITPPGPVMPVSLNSICV